jgi:hypothetical protein
MVNAADAVLSTHGFRLRGKTGSHEARFAFPALPPAFREQANLIAAARKSRNVAMYDDPGRVSDSFGDRGHPNRAAVDRSREPDAALTVDLVIFGVSGTRTPTLCSLLSGPSMIPGSQRYTTRSRALRVAPT